MPALDEVKKRDSVSLTQSDRTAVIDSSALHEYRFFISKLKLAEVSAATSVYTVGDDMERCAAALTRLCTDDTSPFDAKMDTQTEECP